MGLFQVEIICSVRQFENLDALLEIGPIGSEMGTDLPLQGLLLGLILGMEVGPHLLVDLAIQLVLIGLTHPAPDFAEFPIEIVHCLAMKFQLIFLTRLECLDNPGQRLVVEAAILNLELLIVHQESLALRTFSRVGVGWISWEPEIVVCLKMGKVQMLC